MSEQSSTEAEHLVLQSLRSVLADEIRPEDPDDLVIVGNRPVRRRSSLYFVGLGAPDSGCRWVVKQPNIDSHQADLATPLPAVDQFRALTRLHRHLRRSDGSSATPRPVAYLPELAAYVMEYVSGPTLAGMIGPGAVVRSGRLLQGVSRAAEILRDVHSLEPAETRYLGSADLSRLSQDAVSRARQLLESAGLRTWERWFALPGTTVGTAAGTTLREVLLHGDFAPENIVVSRSGFYCLEPDLVERDWAEHDVVRFLLMLCDAPFFVTGVDLAPVQHLRRATVTTFLHAYYGAEPWPAVLQPLMLVSVAARWSTRHTDIVRRAPRLGRARRLLLSRYFAKLLDEVSPPGWPQRTDPADLD